MATLAGELSALTRDPVSWAVDTVEDVSKNLAVVSALALAGGFALHFVLNPLSRVIGYPHGIGGFWACAMVVLGFVAVVHLLRYVLGAIDASNEDRDTLGLAKLLTAIGVAAWVVTLVS